MAVRRGEMNRKVGQSDGTWGDEGDVVCVGRHGEEERVGSGLMI